jgi:methyl-accepting chemotaxis protein
MKWFSNLKTRTKLLLGFAVMIIFMGIVIVTNYIAISTLEASQRSLYDESLANLRDLSNLRTFQNKVRAQMLEAQLIEIPFERERLLADATENSKQTDQIMTGLLTRATNDARLLQGLEELNSVRKEFAQTKDNEIIPLIRAGKISESRQLAVGVQQGRHEKIRTLSEQLTKVAEEDARRALTESEDTAQGLVRLSVGTGIAAILLAAIAALIIARDIGRPLLELTTVAERITLGDLSMSVSADGRSDEVGVLASSINRMTQSLRAMASVAEQIAAGDLSKTIDPQSPIDVLGNAFALMIENLREQTRQLLEGAHVLASAASEIVASTTQLAVGATESATAVSETTTTIEEVRQTAQVSSQKAKTVADNSQKAVQISQSGRKSTEEAVAGSNRIRQQMEAIAASMVRLSEQSQAISQIMATVEDLAAQSNLLAVNAAIEAAKAGEQGKGFVVVAQEVKSLAEQSRQATNQVRTILGEIQKATTAAVLVTEQGSKAAEAGEKQTGAAGESILILTNSVTEAAQSATQIAASSQQQLVGMDQVAGAMESIKQASAQNVASAKQLESAARNLDELGQRLKQMVERYKV